MLSLVVMICPWLASFRTSSKDVAATDGTVKVRTSGGVVSVSAIRMVTGRTAGVNV